MCGSRKCKVRHLKFVITNSDRSSSANCFAFGAEYEVCSYTFDVVVVVIILAVVMIIVSVWLKTTLLQSFFSYNVQVWTFIHVVISVYLVFGLLIRTSVRTLFFFSLIFFFTFQTLLTSFIYLRLLVVVLYFCFRIS